MAKKQTKSGSELFIVDNSDKDWKVLQYLHDWCAQNVIPLVRTRMRSKNYRTTRGGMRGRPNATEYWPYLHDIIVRRNPSAKRLLARFAPENLA